MEKVIESILVTVGAVVIIKYVYKKGYEKGQKDMLRKEEK